MPDETPERDDAPAANPQRAPQRVGFFVPCLTDAFDVRVAECSARLLEAAGMAPLQVPAGQTCCGQALRNAGLLGDAARLGRRMAKVFAGCDAVVTPSASCAAHLRHHGPPELATKTFELATFLLRAGFDPAERGCSWPGRAAYHPSCHGRDPGGAAGFLDDATVALLRRVDGLELAPLPRATQCCGFGGTFATNLPAVSVALGRDKLAAAFEAGVTTLVANDGGCRLHLRTLEGRAVELKHVAEILAEGCRLMPRPPRRTEPAP